MAEKVPPGKLPAPKFCPVCKGELEERVQTIKMLRRPGASRPAWHYTGPGATKPPAKVSRTIKVERPVYVCSSCSVRVVLHRDRKTWPEATARG